MPLVIHPLGILEKRQNPWRFEQVWLTEEGCHTTVEAAWRINPCRSSMVKVEEKLKICQKDLKWWSRRSFGNITCALVEKKNLLKQAEALAMLGGDSSRVVSLKKEIFELLI